MSIICLPSAFVLAQVYGSKLLVAYKLLCITKFMFFNHVKFPVNYKAATHTRLGTPSFLDSPWGKKNFHFHFQTSFPNFQFTVTICYFI